LQQYIGIEDLCYEPALELLLESRQRY
jgi:hypothetical protein